MGEIAFRVDRGCEFYEKYSQMRAEKQKFHDLAREFFNSVDPFESEKYVQCETFMMDLTEDEKKKYSVLVYTVVFLVLEIQMTMM